MKLEELGSLFSDFITNLQSSSKQYGIVTKQTHRSIEQNSKLRNKPMHLWSINLWRSINLKEERLYNEKKTVSSINGAMKTGLLLLLLSRFSRV